MNLLAKGLAALVLLGANAATAQESNGLAGHDTQEPIEITSDTLTVEQNKQLATFAGNVDAIQGQMKLRADRLVVHYARRENSDPASADPNANAIQKIEAFGKVVITSPEENAQGDQGTYDVVAGKVDLEGSVVLTRGGNVIRGTRLDMDLASGVSTVTGAKSNQRVRALFVPQEKPKP